MFKGHSISFLLFLLAAKGSLSKTTCYCGLEMEMPRKPNARPGNISFREGKNLYSVNSGSTSSDIIICSRKIPLSAKTENFHIPNDNVGNKAEMLPAFHASRNEGAKDVTQHAQFYLKVLKDNGILAPSAQLQGF